MNDWSDGYITNTEYTLHFYPFLAPLAQNTALLLSGNAAVDLKADYTYCELGCGHGYTTALLAAVNPQGRFWGVDFNPSHIAGANRLKAAAAIPNVEFLEKSFAELATTDLPSFDFIALHGVWSWISAENRAAAAAFIYSRLKPGGIVYISYNAQPGWSALAPLRQFMMESQRHKTEISPAAVDDSIALAQRAAKIGQGYFLGNPASLASLESLLKAPKNYLIHEYFNRDWTPFYFSEVVSELKASKLGFACSSDVVEHLDQLCISAEAIALLKDQPDPVARETIRDFFRNTRFRRDLFSRGGRKLAVQERTDAVRDMRLVLARPMPQANMQINVPAGSVKLPDVPAVAIVEQLAKGPATFAELMQNPVLAAVGGQQVFHVVMLLIAGNAVQAALPEAGGDTRRAAAARFNKAVLMQPAGLESQTLASPVLGNGVTVQRLDQFLMVLEANGTALTAERILKEAAARGVQLHQTTGEAGAVPSGTAEIETLLDQYHTHRLPAYKRLGLIG